MGGWNDAIVYFLLRHSTDHKGCRTTKAREFAVLVVKKIRDSRTVGCSSSVSAFNLGWEQLFEESPTEERPLDLLGAVNNFIDADTESLLLAASPLFESRGSQAVEPFTRDHRFGTPWSAREIAQVEESHIQRKTKASTTWAISMWQTA